MQYPFLNNISMKINRVVGLLLFLLLGQVLLRDIFSAVSRTVVATMETVEVASETVTYAMQAGK